MPGLKSQAPCGSRLVVVSRVRRREVAIGKALGEDRLSRLAVQGQPLRLLVLFVPVEPQPAQPLKDGLHAGLGVALHVGVVKAQHHGAVVVAGIEPIEDEGARAADVQKAGGRRRKTHARGWTGGRGVRHRSMLILPRALLWILVGSTRVPTAGFPGVLFRHTSSDRRSTLIPTLLLPTLERGPSNEHLEQIAR